MKITDKIHLLKIDFEISISPDKKIPRFVNILILTGDKITLIDTGVKGSETVISKYLESIGRSINEIDSVILSHSHPDHIGSAAEIKKLTGCKTMAHKYEKPWIEDIELQNSERPVPGFFNLVDTPVVIDKLIEDGEQVFIEEGLDLKFILSPGHSRGSLNILFNNSELLFTADSIPLKGDIPNYDNYTDLIKSLNYIKHINYKTLLSSWTSPLSNKSEIEGLIYEGEEYINIINSAVSEFYRPEDEDTMEYCKQTIRKLNLPPFLANRITDKAFRSHLK